MKDVVYYKKTEEVIGRPSMYVDEKHQRVADILSTYTGIDADKLIFFISSFGLKKIFADPDIMGLTSEQLKKVNDLKYIVLSMEVEDAAQD